MTPSRPPLRLVAAVLLLGAAAFAPTLGGGFLGDDFVYVARFAELPWRDWPGLFVREWSDGVWGFGLRELRPFAALSLMVEGRLFGGAAPGYRLVNLAVFLASAWLVMRLAWRHSRGDAWATGAAGGLFVLAPIQVEPVAWITGRVDLLAAAAALGFWHLAETYVETGRRRTLAGAALLLGVGIFSKEFCLLAPLLLALAWVLLPPAAAGGGARRLAVLAAAAALAVLYALARRAALGAEVATPNASWLDPEAWRRQFGYLGWILPVLPFGRDLEFTVPFSPAALQAAAGVLAAAVLGTAAWARWRRRPGAAAIVFFGGVWWLATVLPLLVVAYFTPRHLHFASAGLALAAGLVVARLPGPLLRAGVLAGLAVWFGLGQQRAAADWREAGRQSRDFSAALRAAVAEAPPGAPVLVDGPSRRGQAWLLAWSAPHLAGPPFTTRASGRDLVFAPPGAFYRPGDWPRLVGDPLPAALAGAPAIVVVRLADDGRVASRTLAGTALAEARAALASRTASGMNEVAWRAWMQTLTDR